MEKFSLEFRALHQNDDVDKIEETMALLETCLVLEMDGPAISPVSKLPAKLYGLLQVGLRRTIELSDSSIREMNYGSVTTSYVLVRAALETSCLMLDASRLASKATAKNEITMLKDVDKFLMDTLMGSKSKEWGVSEQYSARNVLAIIQRLSKELALDLMRFYEGLSERAHPNYSGMVGTYQTPPPEGEYAVRFQSPQSEDLKQQLDMAISGLAIATEMMLNAIATFKSIYPAFLALTERSIYENGTWPNGLEYPIKRTVD